MKKTILQLFLSGLLTGLLLVACGGNTPEPQAGSGNSTTDTNNGDMDNMDEEMDHDDMADMNMDDVDMSTSRMSQDGLFMVSYTSDPETVPMNDLHSWTLHVETAPGQPVDDATITIDGGMPEHGHGLPTEPAVTENLGNGDYRVEGLKFQMAGFWEVTFVIDNGDGEDTVTFNLMVEE